MAKPKINKYYISTLTNQTDRIEENFKVLNLNGILASYEHLATEALQNSWTPFELIERMQHLQLTWNESNRIDNWMQKAYFEKITTLEEYDFDFPRKINKTLILELASCRFIKKAENVVFLGPTGVGKTHLATALGIKSIDQGSDTRFITLRTLQEKIDKMTDNPLELRKFMISLQRPKLLILDEVATSDPIPVVAKFLGELLLNRYQKTSTIFTSNKNFQGWSNAFGDEHTSAMLLDRIVSISHIVYIDGESYRNRDRSKHDPSQT